MSDAIVIAPVTPDLRQHLAIIVLKGRLSMAIRFGQTDSYALQMSRYWAERGGYTGKPFRTMKQALAWVLTQIED